MTNLEQKKAEDFLGKHLWQKGMRMEGDKRKGVILKRKGGKIYELSEDQGMRLSFWLKQGKDGTVQVGKAVIPFSEIKYIVTMEEYERRLARKKQEELQKQMQELSKKL